MSQAIETRVPSLRPEPKRAPDGRYLLVDPATGVERPWRRATTLAHALGDSYLIGRWEQRKVAHGVAADPDLATEALRLGEEIDAANDWRQAKEAKGRLDELCNRARHSVGSDNGATLGTDLHSLTEWHDAGRIGEVDVPLDLAPQLANYIGRMDTAEIERPVEYIERVVLNERTRTAGTFDRLGYLPGRRNLPCVLDLKTQKTVTFGFLEPAIQFAQYANAGYILNPDTGKLEPMPPVDREIGILIHLPATGDGFELYELDLVEGWRLARLAVEVLAARGASKEYGSKWAPRVALAGDKLHEAIRATTHPHELLALWREAASGQTWLDAHSVAAREQKAKLSATMTA